MTTTTQEEKLEQQQTQTKLLLANFRKKEQHKQALILNFIKAIIEIRDHLIEHLKNKPQDNDQKIITQEKEDFRTYFHKKNMEGKKTIIQSILSFFSTKDKENTKEIPHLFATDLLSAFDDVTKTTGKELLQEEIDIIKTRYQPILISLLQQDCRILMQAQTEKELNQKLDMLNKKIMPFMGIDEDGINYQLVNTMSRVQDIDSEIRQQATSSEIKEEKSSNMTFEDLLRSQEDINKHDDYNNTTLHYVARDKNTNLLAFLLEIGEDIHAVNQAGNTVFHTAAYSGHPESWRLLQAHTNKLLAERLSHKKDGETEEAITAQLVRETWLRKNKLGETPFSIMFAKTLESKNEFDKKIERAKKIRDIFQPLRVNLFKKISLSVRQYRETMLLKKKLAAVDEALLSTIETFPSNESVSNKSQSCETIVANLKKEFEKITKHYHPSHSILSSPIITTKKQLLEKQKKPSPNDLNDTDTLLDDLSKSLTAPHQQQNLSNSKANNEETTLHVYTQTLNKTRLNDWLSRAAINDKTAQELFTKNNKQQTPLDLLISTKENLENQEKNYPEIEKFAKELFFDIKKHLHTKFLKCAPGTKNYEKLEKRIKLIEEQEEKLIQAGILGEKELEEWKKGFNTTMESADMKESRGISKHFGFTSTTYKFLKNVKQKFDARFKVVGEPKPNAVEPIRENHL